MKEKIENAPILIFLLIGAALAGYIYMGSLTTAEGLQNQIATLSSQLAEKKNNLTRAQNSSAEIPSMKEEIAKISQALSKVTEFMPTDLAPRMVLEKVTKEAKDAGVRVTQSKPIEAVIKNYYDELPIEVEFEGSYSQLALFIYLLSKEDTIVHPVDMELSVDKVEDGQANLRMKGKLVGFKYKENKQ